MYDFKIITSGIITDKIRRVNPYLTSGESEVYKYDYSIKGEKLEIDFDNWNKVKKRANKDIICRGFKEREIFNAHIGKNIGFEQNGTSNKFIRPI